MSVTDDLLADNARYADSFSLIHHTDSGMLTFTDDDFKRSQDDTGIKPGWAAESRGSRPAPSCRTAAPCAASSSTLRRDR